MAMETPREREIAAEDSIKVVCRFRPLNDSEEKAGSKFIVKFPSGNDDNCISIGVCGGALACSPTRTWTATWSGPVLLLSSHILRVDIVSLHRLYIDP